MTKLLKIGDVWEFRHDFTFLLISHSVLHCDLNLAPHIGIEQFKALMK